MDTIIWLDGHTSKISSKEANSKSYNIIIHGRYEFRLILQNSEFAWRGRSKAIALYAAVLNSTSNSMHTAFNDFEEYCDNLCDWYNIYDKEQLKADIEDAYHSQEITN